MSCKCAQKVNRELGKYNTRLVTDLLSGTPILATETVEKKRGARPKAVLATYCPFCGEVLNGN